MMAKTVAVVVQLAETICAMPDCENQIQVIDIGGGLAAAYSDVDPFISALSYRELLETATPSLFSGKNALITEFGRWIFAHAGWAMLRVEYVKKYSGKNTTVLHAGADLFLCKCYRPEFWKRDFLALDESGSIRKGEGIPHILAGPLCFSGCPGMPSCRKYAMAIGC